MLQCFNIICSVMQRAAALKLLKQMKSLVAQGVFFSCGLMLAQIMVSPVSFDKSPDRLFSSIGDDQFISKTSFICPDDR